MLKVVNPHSVTVVVGARSVHCERRVGSIEDPWVVWTWIGVAWTVCVRCPGNIQRLRSVIAHEHPVDEAGCAMHSVCSRHPVNLILL